MKRKFAVIIAALVAALATTLSVSAFADEPNNPFITQPLLEAYPRLYVMKSISKSYGVPGLRLGVLASGDRAMIAALKKDVSIWNIN